MKPIIPARRRRLCAAQFRRKRYVAQNLGLRVRGRRRRPRRCILPVASRWLRSLVRVLPNVLSGRHADGPVGLRLDEIIRLLWPGVFVAMLDEQPCLLRALLAGANQDPRSAEYIAMQRELQLAFGESFARASDRFPCAVIKDVDVPGA